MNPVPKPPRTERKSRKPLPPSSHPIPRGTRPKAINAKRRNREWIRSYESAERVAFVAALGCVVHGCSTGQAIDNAHVVSGGSGRKSDARHIAPICRTHHFILHSNGVRLFEERYFVNLGACALQTERAWRRASGRDGE